jgi:hypothetical protein
VKYLVTHYEIHCVNGGKKQPWFSDAQTLKEALGIAQQQAIGLGLRIVPLSWRDKLPASPDDGVYLCEIRRDMAASGQPRVFA